MKSVTRYPAAAAATAVLTLAITAAVGASPTTYIETFDDGMNHTGWTWDQSPVFGSIESSGGNPGGYFQSHFGALPSLFTSHETFTGNFRERRIGSIGGDLAGIEYASPPGKISIGLIHFNGDPDNPFNHTLASFVTDIDAPVNPDFGWVSFDVDIPFDSLTLPEGWRLTGLHPLIPPSVDWATLIQNVDQIAIGWADPLEPQLLFDVIRGADNLRITYNVPAPGAAAVLLALGGLTTRRRRGASV